MSELKHYGVPGMKWGVRKSVYKSMNRQQRKEAKKKYLQTPEGKTQRAIDIGTLLGGLPGGLIASKIANKKYGSISRESVKRGKEVTKKYENTKIETDKEKLSKLASEGKVNPNSNYIFDSNGNLIAVMWD